jgi:hypothetical protein
MGLINLAAPFVALALIFAFFTLVWWLTKESE